MIKFQIDIKKDRWTEDEVLALPTGESDRFDRKQGSVITESGFDQILAKALSAFANSGGGYLILGIKDDGKIIHGAAKIRKGKVTTRDWLEQKIPYLVAPVLQDFRVHEVEPSEQTQIPPDKVIIVIDVGDSALAPHQSDKDKGYYYRAGGRSEHAPHRYLELLWQRENYPGPHIAAAWVYKVINHLLNAFEFELKYLSERKWRFNKSYPDSSKDLKFYQKNYSGNYEQFYESYPEIFKLIQKHDTGVAEFIKDLEKHYIAIRNSSAMKMIFQEATSLESLKKLKDKEYSRSNPQLQECNCIDDFLKTLFQHPEPDEILDTLSKDAINNYASVGSTNYVPFWNAYGTSFVALSRTNCEEKFIFEKTRDNLSEVIQELLEKLREERNSCTAPF